MVYDPVLLVELIRKMYDADDKIRMIFLEANDKIFRSEVWLV